MRIIAIQPVLHNSPHVLNWIEGLFDDIVTARDNGISLCMTIGCEALQGHTTAFGTSHMSICRTHKRAKSGTDHDQCFAT